jgi:hypothetical protein
MSREPEIPKREQLELATGEGPKNLLVVCSLTADVVD